MKSISTTYPLAWGMLFFLSILHFTQPLSAQGPVAHYPFDGDAQDISGNDNHGTVFGATLATDRFGNANSAYAFDGVDDYIRFVSNQGFRPQLPVTLAAWVLIEEDGAGPIFSNNYQENSYHGVWLNASGRRVRSSFTDGGSIGQVPGGPKRGLLYWLLIRGII